MKISNVINTNCIGSGKVIFNNKMLILANAGVNRGIRIWNPVTGEHLYDLAVRFDYRGSIDFSEDGNMLISASNDKFISIWKLVNENWIPFDTIEINAGNTLDVSINSNAEMIARVNSTSLRVELWSMSEKKLEKTYDFGFIDFHPNKPIIAIRLEELILLSNYENGEDIRDLYAGRNLSSISFNIRGDLLGTINDSGEVIIFEMHSYRRKYTLGEEKFFASKFLFSPKYNIVVVIYESGAIGLWELDNMKLVEVVHSNLWQPDSVAISSDGSMLAIGSGGVDNGIIEIWQL